MFSKSKSLLIQDDGTFGSSTLTHFIDFIFIQLQLNPYSKNYPHKYFQDVTLSIDLIIGVLRL